MTSVLSRTFLPLYVLYIPLFVQSNLQGDMGVQICTAASPVPLYMYLFIKKSVVRKKEVLPLTLWPLWIENGRIIELFSLEKVIKIIKKNLFRELSTSALTIQ